MSSGPLMGRRRCSKHPSLGPPPLRRLASVCVCFIIRTCQTARQPSDRRSRLRLNARAVDPIWPRRQKQQQHQHNWQKAGRRTLNLDRPTDRAAERKANAKAELCAQFALAARLRVCVARSFTEKKKKKKMKKKRGLTFRFAVPRCETVTHDDRGGGGAFSFIRQGCRAGEEGNDLSPKRRRKVALLSLLKYAGSSRPFRLAFQLRTNYGAARISALGTDEEAYFLLSAGNIDGCHYGPRKWTRSCGFGWRGHHLFVARAANSHWWGGGVAVGVCLPIVDDDAKREPFFFRRASSKYVVMFGPRKRHTFGRGL